MSGKAEPPVTVADLPESVSGLVAALMLGMSESALFTLRQLYENERAWRLELQAELGLIRQRIAILVSADYAPSTAVLALALYPSAKAIKVRAEELAREEGS